MENEGVDCREFDEYMRGQEGAGDDVVWHSPDQAPFRLSGFAWFEQDRKYRRMPVNRPEPLPEAVDSLANCTAGGQIGFQTNSRRISIRAQLSAAADMVHMPASGQCGFDLYSGPAEKQRFHTITKYDHTQTDYEVLLLERPKAEQTDFTLNFPLYQGVKEVLVGLDPDADVSPPPPYAIETPVVVYGTSITQGGCASRPGMAYTNILSRRLNIEFINLGFSGSGQGEPEVARAIAAIPTEPALFILDYEANCVSTELFRETLPEFIRILREHHGEMPIMVLSRVRYAWEVLLEEERRGREERLEFQKELVAGLRGKGDNGIFFVDGSDFLGDDFDECSVDGGHPTDLGFYRIAGGLEPVIREAVGLDSTW